MKILYISEQDFDHEGGVSHKVRAQISEWSKNGHQVIGVNASTLQTYNSADRKISYLNKQGEHITGGTLIKLWKNLRTIYQYGKVEKFDVIYSRFLPWTFYLNFLSTISPIIYEINGDYFTEARNKSLSKYLYTRLSMPFMYLSSSGAVFVSKELEAKYGSSFLKTVTIGNGIDDQLFMEPVKNHILSRIQLVFTGSSELNWDTLAQLQIFMKNKFQYHLHVIGCDGSSNENITFHGRVTRSENIEIIKSADIAISTLNFYARGIHEGSPLKSREYLALGLPIITGYEDTDLKGKDFSFVLRIPNQPNSLLLNEKVVTDFITKARNFDKKKIREDVRNLLSYSEKEKFRLTFFESLRK